VGVFRRRRKPSAHQLGGTGPTQIDLLDGWIPLEEERLPAEAVTRLEGVRVLPEFEGRPGPFTLVNVTAARRDAAKRLADLEGGHQALRDLNVPEEVRERIAAELDEATRHVNEWSLTENIFREGDPAPTSDDAFVICPFDYLTGTVIARMGADASLAPPWERFGQVVRPREHTVAAA
jgi:hypothetical protein